MIDLNNTWCEATEENFNALIEKVRLNGSKMDYLMWDVLVIEDYNLCVMVRNYDTKNYKQIHLVDGDFQYVKEEDMVLEHKRYELPKKVKKETELGSFDKHGFETPDFDGEILKEVIGIFIGYVIQDENLYPTKWEKNGRERSIGNSKFNLIPIKKHWYEDESNFPVLIKAIESDNYISMGNKNNYINYIESGNWRPATKEEVLSLLIKE